MSPLPVLSVHALSWMPDLTVFCLLFSCLKYLKIPPARILQSHILDSKVANVFSMYVFHLSLLTSCSSVFIVAEEFTVSLWNSLVQKFFTLHGTVFHKKSSLKPFVTFFTNNTHFRKTRHSMVINSWSYSACLCMENSIIHTLLLLT